MLSLHPCYYHSHFVSFSADDDSGFPSQLYRLKSLRSLTLSYSGITSVPDHISKLFKLQKVTLIHNPLLETISGSLGKANLKGLCLFLSSILVTKRFILIILIFITTCFLIE